MSEIDAVVSSIILGDGYVTKKGNLCFSHTEEHYEYGNWKMNLLKEKGFKFIKTRLINGKSGYVNTKPIYVWQTSACQYFKDLRLIFYPNNKKQVPLNIFNNWNALHLAILYQDDGRCNKMSKKKVVVNGVCESKECSSYVNHYEFCKNLWPKSVYNEFQKLLEKFNIKSKIYDRKNIIYIHDVTSKTNFKKLVKDYICPCMNYKIQLPVSLAVID